LFQSNLLLRCLEYYFMDLNVLLQCFQKCSLRRVIERILQECRRSQIAMDSNSNDGSSTRCDLSSTLPSAESMNDLLRYENYSQLQYSSAYLCPGQWSLCFRESEFDSEFHETLLITLRRCPEVSRLSTHMSPIFRSSGSSRDPVRHRSR